MSNLIQVTAGTLKSKAEEIKGLNGKLKTQIESLKSREEALSAKWEGEANKEFRAAFSKDIIQMNNFYNAIEKYVSTLNEIAVLYENAEKTNVNTAATRK